MIFIMVVINALQLFECLRSKSGCARETKDVCCENSYEPHSLSLSHNYFLLSSIHLYLTLNWWYYDKNWYCKLHRRWRDDGTVLGNKWLLLLCNTYCMQKVKLLKSNKILSRPAVYNNHIQLHFVRVQIFDLKIPFPIYLNHFSFIVHLLWK